MRQVLRLGFVLLPLLLLLNACYYDVEETLYPDDALPPCDTLTVTFSGSVEPILSANCYVCHAASAAQGGVVLEGHAEVMNNVLDGRLLGSVSHSPGFSPMPKNLPKLPACNISTIATWIRDGAPNN